MGWSASLKNAEFFVVLFLMVIVVALCVYAKQISGQSWIADTALVALHLEGSDIPTTILHAFNISTILYAVYFYVVRARMLGCVFMLCAIGVCIAAFLSSYTIAFQLSQENPFYLEVLSEKNTAGLYLLSEYTVSIVMTAFFAVADFYKSTKIEDDSEKALLKFSSLYLSVPALIALLASGALYVFYLDPSLSLAAAHPGEIAEVSPTVAYLAGTGAMVLFLTNLILAMAAAPWYAPRLRLTFR